MFTLFKLYSRTITFVKFTIRRKEAILFVEFISIYPCITCIKKKQLHAGLFIRY